MGLLDRFYSIFKAKAHSVADKFEDRLDVIEQEPLKKWTAKKTAIAGIVGGISIPIIIAVILKFVFGI